MSYITFAVIVLLFHFAFTVIAMLASDEKKNRLKCILANRPGFCEIVTDIA